MESKGVVIPDLVASTTGLLSSTRGNSNLPHLEVVDDFVQTRDDSYVASVKELMSLFESQTGAGDEEVKERRRHSVPQTSPSSSTSVMSLPQTPLSVRRRRILSPIAEDKTPQTSSPMVSHLSRTKKNTYQSSKVQDIRKKFQQLEQLTNNTPVTRPPKHILPSAHSRNVSSKGQSISHTASSVTTPTRKNASKEASTVTVIACDKNTMPTTSVVEAQTVHNTVQQQPDAINKTVTSCLPPPAKPPRTFAHDVYVQQKEELKILVNQKYRKCHNQVNEESHHHTSRSSTKQINRRRSRSIDLMETPRLPFHAVPPVRRKVRPSRHHVIEAYHVSDLFDSSTQASAETLSEENQQPRIVADVIRRSFGAFDQMDISSPPIDLKDIEDKVIYAKTLRTKFRGNTLSHYSTISDLGKDPAIGKSSTKSCPPQREDAQGTNTLCKFFAEFDASTGKIQVFPSNASDSKKAEFVGKFARPTCQSTSGFCWFSFSENNFLYTYFLRTRSSDSEGLSTRVISVSSDLYSPQFFSLLLKAFENDVVESPSRVRQTTQSSNKLLSSPKVKKLLNEKIPLPGDTIEVNGGVVTVPWDYQLTSVKPSILLSSLESEDIFKCVATLIHERRLVFVSLKVDSLIESTKALVSLLYPLQWDYMFWPVVPEDLVTWTAALTTPYFVGLERTYLPTFLSAIEKRSEKLLILDLDSRQLILEVGDESKILPKNYMRSVVKALDLSKNMTDPTGTNRDIVMKEAFLQVFLEILGPITATVTKGTFSKDQYLKSVKNRALRSFLTWFCETRLFQNFLRYWHVKYLHSKYIPVGSQLKKMDLFERRTQHFRLQDAKDHPFMTSTESTKSQSSVGWSESALRVIESRFHAMMVKSWNVFKKSTSAKKE